MSLFDLCCQGLFVVQPTLSPMVQSKMGSKNYNKDVSFTGSRGCCQLTYGALGENCSLFKRGPMAKATCKL